jgi:hypothetical protein
MVMGGFYKRDGPLDHWGRLTVESFPEMLKRDAPPSEVSREDEPSTDPTTLPTPGDCPSEFRILVTESEILDKSKGDGLGKLFTLLQTTWFIVQYLERWVAYQPRTQLEVMTLAYAALNILVYALWWDKPLNIQEPIYIHGRASAPISRTKGLHGLWSVLGSAFRSTVVSRPGDGVTEMTLYIVLPSVGILFGGVHCFAWQFPFPTGQEKVLWRVSAVYCTASPFLIPLLGFIFEAPHGFLPVWINLVLEWVRFAFEKIRDLLSWLGGRHAGIIFSMVITSPMVLYVACRIILVVLTFTSLRAPPAGVYEATFWTSFLPHFG